MKKEINIEDLSTTKEYLFQVFNIKTEKHVLTTIETPQEIERMFPIHTFYYFIEGEGKELHFTIEGHDIYKDGVHYLTAKDDKEAFNLLRVLNRNNENLITPTL